jgi:hypothetical protein
MLGMIKRESSGNCVLDWAEEPIGCDDLELAAGRHDYGSSLFDMTFIAIMLEA